MNVYLIPWFLIIDDQFGPFYVKGTLRATHPWDKILCLGSSFAFCNYILCLNRMVEYLLMVWRGVKILTTLGGWQTLSFLHLLSNSSFNSSWVEERQPGEGKNGWKSGDGKDKTGDDVSVFHFVRRRHWGKETGEEEEQGDEGVFQVRFPRVHSSWNSESQDFQVQATMHSFQKARV